MNIRKEIKEWFKIYLSSVFIIIPTISVFLEGLVNIDKDFFILYLVHSLIALTVFVFIVAVILVKWVFCKRERW